MDPAEENVYAEGAPEVQPVAPVAGCAADSVTKYPVTAVLSVAVREVIEMVKEDDVEGILKAVTVGGVVSDTGMSVNTALTVVLPVIVLVQVAEVPEHAPPHEVNV